MSSNKELAAEAAELAEELKIDISTDGLNNKDLSTLVSDLKAKKKKKDAELQTQAAAEEDERAPGVYVDDGKAVTSKIGVLAEGRAVEAKYFVGGQETLDNLIERGYCVKVD